MPERVSPYRVLIPSLLLYSRFGMLQLAENIPPGQPPAAAYTREYTQAGGNLAIASIVDGLLTHAVWVQGIDPSEEHLFRGVLLFFSPFLRK